MELVEYFVRRARSIRLIALARFDTRCHAAKTARTSKSLWPRWTYWPIGSVALAFRIGAVRSRDHTRSGPRTGRELLRERAGPTRNRYQLPDQGVHRVAGVHAGA